MKTLLLCLASMACFAASALVFIAFKLLNRDDWGCVAPTLLFVALLIGGIFCITRIGQIRKLFRNVINGADAD